MNKLPLWKVKEIISKLSQSSVSFSIFVVRGKNKEDTQEVQCAITDYFDLIATFTIWINDDKYHIISLNINDVSPMRAKKIGEFLIRLETTLNEVKQNEIQ